MIANRTFPAVTGILAPALTGILTMVLGFLLTSPVELRAQKNRKKKKDTELVTQTLAVPRDPPPVATGETRRLVFQNVPQTAKGLLTQQTKDALKAAARLAGGPIIHIRALVSGSGDLRRVPQLVSETFTDRNVKLPAVSVVQVGALPLANSQIALQIVSLAKKDVNPDGIDFLAGDTVAENNPGISARPLLDRALDSIAGKTGGRPAVSLTCFVSSLQEGDALSAAMAAKFPAAATLLVQPQRGPYQSYATCQAVVRGGITANTLAFSGTRVSASAEESQAALALQRMDHDLTEAGAGADGLRFTTVYSLLPQAGDLVRRLRKGAISIIPVESVASLQAGFALDSIAAVGR